MSREIGEAQIVHTIFGKAKVRIIRKHDKMRRTLWWAGVAGAAAIAAVVWQQGWFAPQQAESLQSAEALPAASPEAQSSAMASPAEGGSFPASAVGGAANAPAEPAFQTLPQKLIAQQANEIRAAEKAAMSGMEQNKPAVVARQKPAATPPMPAAAQSEPMTPRAVIAKPRPAVPPPGMEGKPTAAPLADNAMKNPAGVSQPAKPTPAAPAAATTTRVTQPAASSSAAAVPTASPSIKENSAPQLPTGDKTLSDPVNTSGK
jgi:hypothetical protein